MIDSGEPWSNIEEEARSSHKQHPSLSQAEAKMKAVKLNPELERQYHLAQSRAAVEAKLRKAEACYTTRKKAAELQKRDPDLKREEVLGKVFDAEPETYAAATGAHV